MRWLSLILSLAGLLVALFVCWSAASDAQGALAFIFIWPMALTLGATGVVLAYKRKAEAKKIFWVALICFIPNVAAPLLIDSVSEGFEWITGKSRYAWSRRNQE